MEFFNGKQATLSATGSNKFSANNESEAQSFANKRQKYMENIRRNAREELSRNRRTQPNLFASEDNTGNVLMNFDHLEGVPNREQLIVKLKEFNDIDVTDFKDPEINDIAKTLRSGEL
jgi:hypothetical protein